MATCNLTIRVFGDTDDDISRVMSLLLGDGQYDAGNNIYNFSTPEKNLSLHFVLGQEVNTICDILLHAINQPSSLESEDRIKTLSRELCLRSTERTMFVIFLVNKPPEDDFDVYQFEGINAFQCSLVNFDDKNTVVGEFEDILKDNWRSITTRSHTSVVEDKCSVLHLASYEEKPPTSYCVIL